MEVVRTTFNDRVSDIESYYSLLLFIDQGITAGVTTISMSNANFSVSPSLKKNLFANIYLHLYNLVESTVTLLLKAAEKKIINDVSINGINVLNRDIQALWIRYIAGTHDILPPEKRLEKALDMCGYFLQQFPFSLEIPKGGGGNWDNENIRLLANRLGVNLTIPRAINSSIKIPVKDGKGPIQVITITRNKLAHGEISFSECGEDLTVVLVRKLIDISVNYLRVVIDCFENYLNNGHYKITN
ncbi:hypothetical protein BV923_13255 [Pectobacterium odoriferum]|uniref:MAE_28990/MAE_18760 family HEPN-like nuclease n=1 Tax=Pectobacterium odoriferum TaxID=78398 RepID=UPI000CD288A5|nr:MAE_28990/MAE_18760 family HEPN-like nuclease [Pectobacterium odoriferum]POE21529.1 hypothetical protein BV923_13255 [Pectobacterium odoriferum]